MYLFVWNVSLLLYLLTFSSLLVFLIIGFSIGYTVAIIDKFCYTL